MEIKYKKQLNKHKDKKHFTKTATETKKINTSKTQQRGGFKL